ncbi:MAG: magnesium chelatase [Luteitalea sp.]|nr:magnesium chelatase [Luteitalea sp.]
MARPKTLGALKRDVAAGRIPHRSVRAEIRQNLIARLKQAGPLFPGIIGYDDTVIPQLVNALLSQHDFVLLGLRGQAKSRILRALVTLLDPEVAVVPGSEIHDDPLAPLSAFAKRRVQDEGDSLPIEWLPREARYVEKLATPDVTVADIIGDIDPIKAARAGLQLSDELTMHYGLLPRANRSIFAINELPDLAGRIQVSLFNILQEGDVQIKGYPVRLPLDVLMVFSANPEDYTARGKIITPLKDRIGSEIRTHYPRTREAAMAITQQEAWVDRDGHGALPVDVPAYVREIIEEIAFQARVDSKVDKRSGVSQRLPITCIENVVSNAERRALLGNEAIVVPRVADVYAALPALTGKLELEYEGELRGADTVGRDIVRAAVRVVFDSYDDDADVRGVIEWFDMGGTLQLSDTLTAAELLDEAGKVQGLAEIADQVDTDAGRDSARRAAAIDFVLEGLHAQKRISRSETWQYEAAEPPRRRIRATQPTIEDEELPSPGGKKLYN